MEEEELEECNTSLNLGIGLGEYIATKNNAKQKKNNKRRAGVCLDFSLSPQLVHHHQPKEEVINIDEDEDDDDDDDDGLIKNMHQLVWGSKRKIEEEEQDDKKSSSSNNNSIDKYYYSNDIHNNISKEKEKEKEKNCGRKKLRLNKEQSTLLEDSFKQHTSLNAVQKQALAVKLNLQPRQVEVWFQNRRARTKLKQTEVEWELLKKWCQALTEENRRLKKELQELTTTTTELKQLKPPLSLPLPLYIQLSRNNNAAAATTTLTVCASCQNFLKAESTHVDVVLPNTSPPN